ncbi:bifunctional 2-keto-4-hydroxyglutarate aldolase/2-keto-3-deoxy-6-phosphogluconate aldolase [Lacticaseibacillus saniviri]
MQKMDYLNRMQQAGVIAVVRADDADTAVKLSQAVIAGGVTGIELTFTVPHADQAITTLVDQYHDDDSVIIGAGTVLDATTARIAIMNGAQFIVSPSFNQEVAEICNLYAVPYVPGCMTPTEMQSALIAGVDLVKLFPGNVLKPDMVKAVMAPFPFLSIMPSGGVSVENMADWFAAGVSAVGAGSNLTKAGLSGDFAAVTETANAYRAELDKIRK